MQFKWAPTCLYNKVDKKYTGCNLKTTALVDSGPIGVVVIMWNTVSDIVDRICNVSKKFKVLISLHICAA